MVYLVLTRPVYFSDYAHQYKNFKQGSFPFDVWRL